MTKFYLYSIGSIIARLLITLCYVFLIAKLLFNSETIKLDRILYFLLAGYVIAIFSVLSVSKNVFNILINFLKLNSISICLAILFAWGGIAKGVLPLWFDGKGPPLDHFLTILFWLLPIIFLSGAWFIKKNKLNVFHIEINIGLPKRN